MAGLDCPDGRLVQRSPLGDPKYCRRPWDELNLLKSLPPHPNIVPFDRVVLEDVESRVIGFTTKYIPGGTLANPKVPFRFEWIQQLTQPAYMAGPTNRARLQCTFRAGQNLGWRANWDNGPAV